MARPLLHDLAEPHFWFREPGPWWWLHDRVHRHTLNCWERVARETLRNGDLETLHASRDDYRNYLLATLKLLDGYTVLAGLFGSEFGPPHFERLENSKALIQQHYDSLFPKWQTVEDLEDILLARITPSNEQLKALAAKSPPPQSWYDEVWEDAPGATPAGP